MPARTIPISRLKVGMYLVGLDRSWLLTPFLRHQFLIQHEHEIAMLRKAGVATVVIDTDRGKDVEDEPTTSRKVSAPQTAQPAPPSTSNNGPAATGEDPKPSVARPSPQQLATHFSQAKHHREQWLSQAKVLFEKTRATDVIDAGEARHIVDDVLGSLLERQAAYLAVIGLGQPDADLQEHGLTVCTLSLALGKSLGLEEDRLRLLGMGALLHDIGLLKLPRNIMKMKRLQRLSPAQHTLYETHPEEGNRIMQKNGLEEPDLRSIITDHHRCEPATDQAADPPSGTDLVKLVGVIDQYDELLTGQTGLPPLSPNQALSQLYQRLQMHDEWRIIASSLIKLVGIYPLYSLVSLTSGEVGLVAAVTPGKAHLPYLYLCRDKFQRPYVPPKPLDLTQEPENGRRVKAVLDPRQCDIDIELVLKQAAA
ncbi:MAG: DUF3391 domain-containing protein [Nitrospira sp.]|nr:DUF3391 domain-containing protein [Nitrospira sp.]MCP9442210.1 DUF3391 domain-containing protein [Nitrospira sp.]